MMMMMIIQFFLSFCSITNDYHRCRKIQCSNDKQWIDECNKWSFYPTKRNGKRKKTTQPPPTWLSSSINEFYSDARIFFIYKMKKSDKFFFSKGFNRNTHSRLVKLYDTKRLVNRVRFKTYKQKLIFTLHSIGNWESKGKKFQIQFHHNH